MIGTQTPWVEAILLNKKAKKVVTLEYGYFIRFAINVLPIRYDKFKLGFVMLIEEELVSGMGRGGFNEFH